MSNPHSAVLKNLDSDTFVVVVMSGHVNHLISIQHVFHLLKIRLKPQKPPQTTKSKDGCIRGLEERH